MKLIEIPKVLKKYVKESRDFDMGITYYTGNLVQDIKTLTKSSEVFIYASKVIDKKDFSQSFSGIINDLEVYLPFKGYVNIDSLKDRLNKDLQKVNRELETLNKRLSNKNFVDKAPEDIVDQSRFKLKEGSLQIEKINKKLNLLDQL